jgi:ornithine carbamoyltransferase
MGKPSKAKDFLSIADLQPQDVESVVRHALRLKKKQEATRPLEGKFIALLFEKPSLRTRSSFEVGIRQLGGQAVYFGKEEVGLGVREPVPDVARVLDRMFDGIVARVFSHENLKLLASHTRKPVVNALSDVEHPCQALADLLTLLERFNGFKGRKLAYIGDGNNVAASLALACASVGTEFAIASPKEYKVPAEQWDEAARRAAATGTRVSWHESPQEAVNGADAVYTDVWVSMGQEAENAVRMKVFKGYQVNPALMKRAKPGAIFLHDMPAHEGEEISKGMLDHPSSVVFDQAENRLHAQKAMLARLFAQ